MILLKKNQPITFLGLVAFVCTLGMGEPASGQRTNEPVAAKQTDGQEINEPTPPKTQIDGAENRKQALKKLLVTNESEYLKKLNKSFAPKTQTDGQEIDDPAPTQEINKPIPATQIERIRIGPHPKYTRLLVDITGLVQYQVSADFTGKKINLIFDDASAGPKVKPRKYRDKNLSAIGVQSSEDQVTLTLHLKNPNTRFFHYATKTPSQIVLDLKGKPEPFIKTKIGKTKVGKKEPGDAKPQEPKSARMKGLSPEQIKEIVLKDAEEKKEHGWAEYQEALNHILQKKFEDYKNMEEGEPDPETGEPTEIEVDKPGALSLLRKFAKDFPKSPLLPNILYLLAEAEFDKAWKSPISRKGGTPPFEPALAAYKHAIRKFPNSRFYEHALYKIGLIYNSLGYVLEARTVFEEGINRNPKSLYNVARKTSLANMLLDEERYKDAYKAFQLILKKSPKNAEGQLAIIKIANQYFDQKDFDQALKIYKEAKRRWPLLVNNTPIIFNNMAEIYFQKRNYPKAKKAYFETINLDPDGGKAHRALNRIGDIYLLQGKEMNALAVYDQSAKLDPESRESQYGKIRMADIGVRNSRLPVSNAVFNVNAYFEPLKTYNEIFESAKDLDILAEVTLSKGIALLKEQNYLKAIQEFKKLLPLGEESKFYRDASKYTHQALVFLVDGYAKQGGVVPILYSYTDYASLSIGKIQNLKTLLQIGEAYQAVGMLPEAVRFYEKVKQQDTRKSYNDRIFLNLGQVHYDKKNYGEAELVARSFLKTFPRSSKVREAMKLLANSFTGREQYDNALKAYQDIIKKFPQDPSEIHYLLATVEARTNRASEAITAYKKSIDTFVSTRKIVPNYIREAHYKIGDLLYQNKKFTESIDALSKAIKLFPDHPDRSWSELILADALKKVQNNQKATAQLNQLIKSESGVDIMKKAAASQLKMMEWEKENKGSL